MLKRTLALIACAAIAIPAAAQIGAPGATDWVKKLQPQAKSPFPAAVPAGRAEDYVNIVNLLNTYWIALDAGDVETYVSLFAPNAELYWIGGVERGTDQIRKNISDFGTGRKKVPAGTTERPRFIHTVGSQRIDFTGPNTAHDVGMWLGFNNGTPDKKFETAEFGHYEDKYVKINGRWYFQERRIWNERLTNKSLYYPELGEPDPRQK